MVDRSFPSWKTVPVDGGTGLGRAAAVVGALAGLAAAVFLAGVVFALASVAGSVALDWALGLVAAVLVVATAAVAAHAGGHAWFVPLPAAALGAVWAWSVLADGRRAGTWWLLAGSAAFSALAVVFAGSVLRARVASGRALAPTLVGADGVVVRALSPVGIVRAGGETWTAESISGALGPGTSVHVLRVEGLRLLVWSEQGEVPGAEALPGRTGA